MSSLYHIESSLNLQDREPLFTSEHCEEAEVKDRRGDQRGGGGEWEPIKILLENLAYIPKSTRNPSLLTRPRPPSYRQAIDLRNRVRNCNESTERC
jgi:hypothetical protein